MDGGLTAEPDGLKWGGFNGTGKPVVYMNLLHFAPEDVDAFVAELNESFFPLAWAWPNEKRLLGVF